MPVELDLNLVHQLLSPHETYLVYAIRNQQQPIVKNNQSSIAALVHSIKQNIEANSYQTPILTANIDGFEYSVYAYLGKLSKPKIRLVALAYALRMQSLLNSKKKMAILSGGGVLRSKKLQKGSTLSLLANLSSLNKEITDYEDIHLFSFFWREERKSNPLLSYATKRSNPFIVC